MRGDVVFHVYGVHVGRDEDVFFGAFRTASEADAQIAKLKAQEMNGRNWAEQYHNSGFIIRDVVVETDFEIPTRPTPREKYFVKLTAEKNRPGTWDSTLVDVFHRNVSVGDAVTVCRYERSYAMLQTFEPFRQAGRELALISRDYTKTAVLDLTSGEVIAEEAGEPKGGGFCPVGFYVPDWHDVHNGTVIPGSKRWTADHEWPLGDFGFVWGCLWGDDSSWKVQYLDLSRVQQGIVTRDERFGYVELATTGFSSPCLDPEPAQKPASPSFVRVSKYKGIVKVTFAVEMGFDLASGEAQEWRRLRIANFE
jgi:hypothetical protein